MDQDTDDIIEGLAPSFFGLVLADMLTQQGTLSTPALRYVGFLGIVYAVQKFMAPEKRDRRPGRRVLNELTFDPSWDRLQYFDSNDRRYADPSYYAD